MTEQRYRAVLEVQAGVPVIEVAERFGVSRQAVHRWVRWYRDEGLDGLSDRSHRPHAHPAQTSLEVEAAICELRRNHPRWGQRRLQFELGRNGCPGPDTRADHHLPRPGAARAHPARLTPAPPGGLSAVATGSSDGTVATGHRRRHPVGRRRRGKSGHRGGRSFPVLRHRHRGPNGDGPCGVPGVC